MRVQDNNLTGTAASGASEAQRLDRTAGSSAGASRTQSGDKVSISGLAGRVSQQLEAAAAARENRIQTLSSLMQGGKYQVNPAVVSHSIVNDALAGNGI